MLTPGLRRLVLITCDMLLLRCARRAAVEQAFLEELPTSGAAPRRPATDADGRLPAGSVRRRVALRQRQILADLFASAVAGALVLPADLQRPMAALLPSARPATEDAAVHTAAEEAPNCADVAAVAPGSKSLLLCGGVDPPLSYCCGVAAE